jgi:N-acetylneuraminate synthase
MYFDTQTSKFTIAAATPLSRALVTLASAPGHTLFVLNQAQKVVGIIDDTAVRAWVGGQQVFDSEVPVDQVARKAILTAPADASRVRIQTLLAQQPFVPLIDQWGKLVSVARDDRGALSIDSVAVSTQAPVCIIAEIGNNHNGDVALAKRMVDAAIHAGADMVKFQLRDLSTMHRNKGVANDASADLGDQYTLDLLSKFQLTTEEHFEIYDYVRAKGAVPLCTPWDLVSLERLEKYGMPAYKVASADFTNHELLERLALTGKPLLCSTGMTTEEEIQLSVSLLKKHGAQYVLLHCNSTYPAPMKDINLKYMSRLATIGESLVGYSSHEHGTAAVVAAVALGARVIEKHFTLDKTMEGNDHRVSLLPEEFALMVQQIRDVEAALGTSDERMLTQGEKMNREVLGKSLIINTALSAGQTIEESMVEVKSPGQGLAPYHKRVLIGRTAVRNFVPGDFFFPQDIGGSSSLAKKYAFSRPFGLPVRYHDFEQLLPQSNFDLIEFHLSYKDLDVELSKYLRGTYDIDFLVHAPELFANDHTLDLCTADEVYRQRSIQEMQRVIDVTRALKKYFPKTQVPRIITNAGGFTESSHVDDSKKKELYARLADSLSKLDREGVEVIIQTMPPFPWHFGGQRYHNLFVDPKETAAFCAEQHVRICLDVSHTQLGAAQYGWSLVDFVEQTGPYITHLHLADSTGVDGEGLQIGEGEIDFVALANALSKYAPEASFIPEIWQGHKNNGEGFWVGLARLEKHFGA